MNSASTTDHHYHVMQPEGRAFLTSRVRLHKDFQIVDLPKEEIDFDDPTKAMPLLVAATNYGPIVFAVAARPAYGDGTTSQWLEFMLRKDGFELDAMRPTTIGIYPAVTCDARQQGDGVVMRSRMILIEDGSRMLMMSGMAPEEIWSAAEAKLTIMINSFEFQNDRGPTVPLFPGEAVPVAPEMGLPPAAPTAAAVAVAPDQAESTATTETAPTAQLTAAEFAELVLAADAASLDQDLGINARFRDQGVGLVPRILSVDEEERSARVGAGAIEGIFRVPFGWHVNDDGRRVLVFDADGRMQISLNLREHDGGSLVDFARGLVEPYLEREPELPVSVLEFAGGIVGAGVAGAAIEGEKLDQAFLVRAAGREGLVVVARVTGAGDDSRLALNLAGDILARLETAADLVAQK